jgi:DNA polymerase III delta prime subunit
MALRTTVAGISSPEDLAQALTGAMYLADDGIATAGYLSLALGKPLLLEGAPGVGKTEAAKAIAGICSGASWSGCNASRASTRRPRSTNGIIRARCWRSARRGEGEIDIYATTS